MTSSAGRTLGRYRLERLVGRGGMAEVWEARDQTLGRRVAVKIIAPDLAADARFHERFLSEARSVAALEHGNVLPIYDFGESEGEPYLVMPFVESGTLADRLKQGDVPVEQAIDWVRQLAAALDAAHAAGVLHRDVKPANVMLGAGGHLLLADFGIAKSSQSGDLTATGLALGTPAYMAPELARGEPAGSSSDRYALGVLAYELLCGRPPFAADNPLALLHQHLTTPVPMVSGLRPELPDDLDPVFARILAKDPSERPASCAALVDGIAQAFGGATGVVARPAGRTLAPRRGPDDPTLAAPVTREAPATPVTRRMAEPVPQRSAVEPSPPRSASRRTEAIVAAVVMLLALGGALLWSATRDRRGAASAPASTETAPAADAGEPEPQRRNGGAEAATSGPAPLAEAAGDDERTTAVETASLPPPRAAAVSAARPDPPEPPAREVKSPPVTDAPEASADDALAAAPAPDAFPARPGAGNWAVPPADALAIFDLIGDAWRKGRFQPGLFDEAERRVASLRRAAGATPGVELLESWVTGGQALVEGDRERARESVRAFFAIQNPPEWATLLPARFLPRHVDPPSDWQLAIFWGDPRDEARALVKEALDRSPNERNLLLARAVVEHLDGRHAEAATHAVALESMARGPARVVLARFAGDQFLWSGDVPQAISWYKKLLVTPDRTEIAAVLRTLTEEGGPQLVARACTEGFQPACDAGRSRPAQRNRRARQLP